MAISLLKKEKMSLTKASAGLNNILVEVSWSVDPSLVKKGPKNPKGLYDADLSAFICESRLVKGVQVEQVIDDVFTCFFGNQTTADGAVCAVDGDNLGNDGDGSESISVDLSKLDPRASEVAFVVTIDKGADRNQSFGMITGGKITVTDQDSGDTLVEFKYGDEGYTTETAIQVASLVRNGSDWEFHANGAGGVKSFEDIAVQDFGFPA